jgi:hypothetical protein
MDFIKRIPPLVWVGAAAVLAYLYFSHKSSASSAQQQGSVKTGGGGGSIRTGNVKIAKDAIDIRVMQDGQGEHQHQPGGHGHGKHKHPSDTTKEITVPQDETLGELAKYLHWSDKTLADVEEMNAVGGQELTASSKLKKGQTIIRPVAPYKS